MESNEGLFFYQGNTEIRDSRDATREAFKVNLIRHGDIWMDMIVSRNKTSHTYDEETAAEITENIINDYVTLFNDFYAQMVALRQREQKELFEEE